MKVKTNLTNSELARVGKGLTELSKATKEYVPQNNAEQVVLQRVGLVFDQYIDGIQKVFEEVLSANP